jgi:hypothetical protein
VLDVSTALLVCPDPCPLLCPSSPFDAEGLESLTKRLRLPWINVGQYSYQTRSHRTATLCTKYFMQAGGRGSVPENFLLVNVLKTARAVWIDIGHGSLCWKTTADALHATTSITLPYQPLLPGARETPVTDGGLRLHF